MMSYRATVLDFSIKQENTRRQRRTRTNWRHRVGQRRRSSRWPKFTRTHADADPAAADLGAAPTSSGSGQVRTSPRSTGCSARSASTRAEPGPDDRGCSWSGNLDRDADLRPLRAMGQRPAVSQMVLSRERVRSARSLPARGGAGTAGHGLVRHQHLDHPRPGRRPSASSGSTAGTGLKIGAGRRDHGDPGGLLAAVGYRAIARFERWTVPVTVAVLAAMTDRGVDEDRRELGLRGGPARQGALERAERADDRDRDRLGDHLVRLRVGLLPVRASSAVPRAALPGQCARSVPADGVARDLGATLGHGSQSDRPWPAGRRSHSAAWRCR